VLVVDDGGAVLWVVGAAVVDGSCFGGPAGIGTNGAWVVVGARVVVVGGRVVEVVVGGRVVVVVFGSVVVGACVVDVLCSVLVVGFSVVVVGFSVVVVGFSVVVGATLVLDLLLLDPSWLELVAWPASSGGPAPLKV
jgi:hypothetical protein